MSEQTEADVLQGLLPELEAQGYEVYLHPDRRLLPTFFSGYVPDVVAMRNDKNLAIEVTRQHANAPKQLEQITARFAGQPNWEFRIVWLEPTSAQNDLRALSSTAISKSVSEVRDLIDKGSLEGALLLAWASFEALGRALLPNRFLRPQTPGRLVEVLAKEGLVTPSEADTLRLLANKRNKLVHGDLQTSVSQAELRNFVTVLDELLSQVP